MGKAQSQEIEGNVCDTVNHMCDHSVSYNGDDMRGNTENLQQPVHTGYFT